MPKSSPPALRPITVCISSRVSPSRMSSIMPGRASTARLRSGAGFAPSPG